MSLDTTAEAIWREIQTLDVQIRDLIAVRASQFANYNEILARLRENDATSMPSEYWDDEMQAWVKRTLHTPDDANIVPMFRNETPG